MSYHILHLLSRNLKIRIKLDQLQITDLEKGTEKTVPLADVAVIVCATRDTEFSASSLRRMAELNVLLLICNEKFEPCAITLPYYRPTNTELLRRQIEWTPEWKTAMWRQIITSKIRNQAANLAHLKTRHTVLTSIAERCANPKPVGDDVRSLENDSLVTSTRRLRCRKSARRHQEKLSRGELHVQWSQCQHQIRIPAHLEKHQKIYLFPYKSLPT